MCNGTKWNEGIFYSHLYTYYNGAGCLMLMQLWFSKAMHIHGIRGSKCFINQVSYYDDASLVTDIARLVFLKCIQRQQTTTCLFIRCTQNIRLVYKLFNPVNQSPLKLAHPESLRSFRVNNHFDEVKCELKSHAQARKWNRDREKPLDGSIKWQKKKNCMNNPNKKKLKKKIWKYTAETCKYV